MCSNVVIYLRAKLHPHNSGVHNCGHSIWISKLRNWRTPSLASQENQHSYETPNKNNCISNSRFRKQAHYIKQPSPSKKHFHWLFSFLLLLWLNPKVFFNIYSHKLSWHKVFISSGAFAISYMASKFEMGKIQLLVAALHSRTSSLFKHLWLSRNNNGEWDILIPLTYARKSLTLASLDQQLRITTM